MEGGINQNKIKKYIKNILFFKNKLYLCIRKSKIKKTHT